MTNENQTIRCIHWRVAIKIKLSVPNISQNDRKWKSKKLGTSTVHTIGSSGCLLCSVTAACNYYGKTITLAELNDALVKVKGFTNGSLLVYPAVTEVFPDITFDWDIWEKGECADRPAPLDLIDDILASQRVPIVKVDYKPTTSKLDEHWVCIIGKDETGSYFIMDPTDGSTQYFQTRYQDPSRYIFRIVAYSGPVETHEEKIYTEAEMTEVRLTRDGNWNKYIASQEELENVKKENEQLKSDIVNQKSQIKNLNEAMAKMAEEDHDSSVAELELSHKLEEHKFKLEKAQNRVLELERDTETLEEEKKALRERLAASGSVSLKDYTVGEMFRDIVGRILGRR